MPVPNVVPKLGTLLPFNAHRPQMGRFVKILSFNLKRDHQKNFYQRRDYESVDETSLS